MKGNADAFIAYLAAHLGQETVIRKVESTHSGLPPVFVLVYRNTPKDGLMTGVTYGLSAAHHPDWRDGTCELVISLESQDEAWPFAAGFFAERFRGEKSFTYGSVFTLDEPLASDSEMTGLFIFGCPLVGGLPTPVDLSGRRIHFKGAYPLYPGEVEVLRNKGLEWFWRHSQYDMFSVSRPDLSKPAP